MVHSFLRLCGCLVLLLLPLQGALPASALPASAALSPDWGLSLPSFGKLHVVLYEGDFVDTGSIREWTSGVY